MGDLKKLTAFVLFFLLLGLMSACSKEKEKETGSEKVKTTTSAVAVTGNDVFQKSCITCHSSGDISGGQIKLDSAKVHNDFKTEDALSSFVRTRMPKSAPASLSKDEYEAVVKYLWEQKQ